jgi:NTP pyrophosphatase (non-canonical NTP hydrolase)
MSAGGAEWAAIVPSGARRRKLGFQMLAPADEPLAVQCERRGGHNGRAACAAAAISLPGRAPCSYTISTTGAPRGQAGTMDPLNRLREELRAFAAVREWGPFHTPKNLAMALAGEAGELLEQFQWLTPEQSMTLEASRHAAVRDEIADVFIYLVQLCDRLGIDLWEATREKMARNAVKYPPERRGQPK